MIESQTIIEALDAIENKSPSMKVLIQFIRETNANFHQVHDEAVQIQKSIEDRITRLESHILGINGHNGYKKTIAEHEDRIDVLERGLAKWITRIITVVVMLNVIVLPLLLWIFFHLLKLQNGIAGVP